MFRTKKKMYLFFGKINKFIFFLALICTPLMAEIDRKIIKPLTRKKKEAPASNVRNRRASKFREISSAYVGRLYDDHHQ